MRPYETMLRRYRETARGLLGCFPRFHRRLPPPVTPPARRPRGGASHLSVIREGGPASRVALSAQAGVAPRHGRVSVSREKQWPR